MHKKIVIAGYYGFGNTGDETILAAMIQDFHDLDPDLSIIVVSGDPLQTKKSHRVEAIPWADIQQIIDAIRSCDLVILGGGGLFHDYWGFDSATILTSNHIGVPFYTSIALLSTIFNKKLMLFSVGVGPLLSDEGKNHVRAIAEQASIISVRDRESKELLRSLGISSNQITVTADPSFRLRFNYKNNLTAAKTPEKSLKLGIALRNWDVAVSPEFWEHQVATAVDNFLDSHSDGQAVFIHFQDQGETLLDDYGVARRVRHLMKNSKRTTILKRSSTFLDKARALSGCDLVIGMRLHALILAAKSGVPVVGLIYDPKVKNILTQLGIQKYGISLSGISSTSLNSLLEQVYQNRNAIADSISETCSMLAMRAEKNNQLAGALLSETPLNLPPLSSSAQQLLKNAALSMALQLDAESKHAVQLNFSLLASQEKEREFHQNLQIEKKKNIESIHRISALETRAATDQYEIANLSKELHEIKKSQGWKLLYRIWQIRLFLVPHGSIQERIIRGFFQFLQNGFRYLIGFTKRSLKKSRLQMSRHSYAFYMFKKNRDRIVNSNLNSLRVPCQPGLVSIILPVFNGSAYIREALDSILNQTYTNFELITINDGSIDNTAEILEEYAKKDQRIRFVNQENQKLPRSLNNGFELAKGEFLTWTSHDNRLKPEFLERMVAYLKRNPSWDMVYANMDIIGEDGRYLQKSDWYAGYQVPSGSEHIHLPSNTSELNTFANNFIGGAFLYRKRVHCLIDGYSPSQFTREDYDYWMRVNALLKLKHADFNLPVYDYRFHHQSLTSKDDELRITSDRKFLMVFDDFRRDLYLTQISWITDSEGLDPLIQDKVEAVVRWIKKTGHNVFNLPQIRQMALPKRWIPLIYLKISSDPYLQAPSPEIIPPGAIKVLLCVTNADLPENTDKNWDICLAWGNQESPADLGQRPHGWWASSELSTLLGAIDIFARNEHARRIEEEILFGKPSRLKMTVIICTYKRAQMLENVLRSIARQSMPQKDYEVLVIDNDPDVSILKPTIDRIRSEAFGSSPEHLRLIHCPVLGLSHARNAGISEAKSGILVFLDDDATAKNDLLEEYWKAYREHPDAGVMGGHIILDRPAKLDMVWKDGWERYWSHFVTGYSEYTSVEKWWEYPWGANWSARRKALLQIGGFRGNYGRTGNDFRGGEEIVAAGLIKSLDYSVAILPQAEVIHHVDLSRFTLNHIKQTIRAGLFSHYQAQIELRLPVESNLANSAYQINKTIGRLIKLIVNLNNPENKAILIETYFQFLAHLQLFKQQIMDDINRFSKNG